MISPILAPGDDPGESLSPEDRQRVETLIDHFEIAAEAGTSLTPEELCAEYPRLLPALKFALRRLAALDRGLLLSHSLTPPKQIGEFEVEEQIGTGGSGVVFRCRQKLPARQVAVKLLKPTIDPAEQRRRFRRELSVVASLRCEGLAEVYVTGLVQWNGVDCFWIAMELLEGGRIDHYVDANKLSEKEVLTLLLAIAKTLQATHRGGVIHCDLKPSNILMAPDGQPHLVDFGVATNAAAEHSTESGEYLAGTAAWMAPELILGETRFADTRTDIYSFGLIACRLLSGKYPDEAVGQAFPEVARIARERSAICLSRLGYPASRDLETLIERLTEPEPADRYQNMDHVVEDLERLLLGRPVSIRRVSLAERSWRWCRQHVAFSALIVVTLMSLAWAVGMAIVSAARERDYSATLSQTNEKLAQSNQQLASANTELNVKSTALSARANELRELIERQERSLISGRLYEISGSLIKSGPERVFEQLNDATLFPVAHRGFAWKILHAQSRPRIETVSCGTARIVSLCFSHDAVHIAVSGMDGVLYFADVVSGRHLWTATASNRRAKICFSPDDKWVYSFSPEDQLLCLNADSGKHREIGLPKIPMDVSLLALSQNGEQLVAVTAKNELLLIDTENDGRILMRQPVERRLRALWFENRDQTIAGLTQEGICVEWSNRDLQVISNHDLKTGESQFRNIVMGDGSTDFAGQSVRLGCNNWAAALVVFPKGTSPTRSISAHADQIREVSLVPPDSMLVTMTTESHIVPLFAPGPGRIVAEKNFRAYSHSVSDDGSRIALGGGSGTVRVVDLTTPDARLMSLHPELAWGDEQVRGFPLAVVTSHDGKRLFAGFSEGHLTETNLTSCQPVAISKVGMRAIPALLLSNDESWLAVGLGGAAADAGIAVYPVRATDQATGDSDMTAKRSLTPTSPEIDGAQPWERTTFVHIGRVKSLCQSTDGKHLYAGLYNGTLAVLDCQSWQILHQWLAHDRGVFAIAVDQGNVISAGSDGFIRIWSETDMSLQQEWHAHDQRILDLCITPDGQRILSASHDNTAAIWTRDGKLVQRMHSHSGPVRTITISDDGQTIATGSEDYTIRLWDGQTGAAQMTLRGDSDFVSDLKFLGNKLLASSHKGTIELWGPPKERNE